MSATAVPISPTGVSGTCNHLMPVDKMTKKMSSLLVQMITLLNGNLRRTYMVGFASHVFPLFIFLGVFIPTCE